MIYRVMDGDKFVVDIYDDVRAKDRFENMSRGECMFIVREVTHRLVDFPTSDVLYCETQESSQTLFEE